MANEYFVNEADLYAVAETIRTKGGTIEQLVFPDGFETAIMAIQSGGEKPQLVVTAPAGSTITAVNGDDTVTGVVGAEGMLTLDLPAFGEWTVTGRMNGMEASTSVHIKQEHPVSLSYITTFAVNGGHGETITAYVDGREIDSVTLDATGEGTLDLSGVGGKTVKFVGSMSGYEKPVNVGDEKEMSVNVYPDGALYWYGRQVVAITTSSSVVGTSGWTYVSPTFNSDHILLKTTNSEKYQCPIITEAPIDISGYSTLKVLIDFTYTGYGSFNFGISPQNTTGYSDASPAKVDSYRTDGNQQTLPVALESVDKTNKYYVFSHAGRIAQAKIYKLWLE